MSPARHSSRRALALNPDEYTLAGHSHSHSPVTLADPHPSECECDDRVSSECGSECQVSVSAGAECEASVSECGAPATLTWITLAPDGRECECEGRVWSRAPLLRGMSAWWVIECGTHRPLLVVQARRRHAVGRLLRGRWRAGAGRTMEVGERYTEAHPASPTGALTARGRAPISLPTVISMEALPAHVMSSLSNPS